MIASLGTSRTKDIRDRAILLVGFWGCYRRSELVQVTADEIGKDAVGKAGALPGSDLCPVDAAWRWSRHAEITSGPLFRPVTPHGSVKPKALDGWAVNDIVKEVANGIGLEGITSYSMRYGVIKAGLDADLPHKALREWMGVRSSVPIDRCAD